MGNFTVVWDIDARDELGRLWINNPRIRIEITAAADLIDSQLGISPLTLGISAAPNIRQYAEPPLEVLYKVSEHDRLVRVLYVKFWIS